MVAVLVVLGLFATWASARWFEPLPPRRITMAAVESSTESEQARRYASELADDGVTVDIRTTSGAADNVGLLLDPESGVDVAFIQGGLVPNPVTSGLVMIASLDFEPLWVFTRAGVAPARLSSLRGLRVAVGPPGSGTRAFVQPLLAANEITPSNTTLLPLGEKDALAALRNGSADAALLLADAREALVGDALRDKSLQLMSFERAGAYERRFPHVTRLTLPAGAIDFGADIPDREIVLIGTETMLVARESIHPAIVNLLVDAAHAISGRQGVFERPGEFPNLDPVDLPVAEQARHHAKFGPSFLHRYLPFWVATFVERAIVIVLPVLLLVLPLLSQLPALLRWHVRSRIYRWYGELALLERDVASRTGPLPVTEWLASLDRIERSAGAARIPASFAAEAYTLREHVDLVRREVLARAGASREADGPNVAPSPDA